LDSSLKSLVQLTAYQTHQQRMLIYENLKKCFIFLRVVFSMSC